MKTQTRVRFLSVILGVLFSQLVVGAAEPPATKAPQKYFVTGRVLDQETGQPVAGAKVKFLVKGVPPTVETSRQGITGEDGWYRVEAALGTFQLWFPILRPGYWLDYADSKAVITTTPQQPIATYDIAARRGPTWIVHAELPADLPAGATGMLNVHEIEDDEDRGKFMRQEAFNFKKRPVPVYSELDSQGNGGLTVCGQSGKLAVFVKMGDAPAIHGELLIEPGFDNTQVRSAARMSPRGVTMMLDAAGKKATIDHAEVTLENGLPLLTFRFPVAKPASKNTLVGGVVDEKNEPLEGVRVAATGVSHSATTDRQGKFALDGPAPESKQPISVMLYLTKDGYAGVDLRPIMLSSGAAQPVPVGKSTLARGRELAVQVVDSGGQPVPGALVEPDGGLAMSLQAVRTDEQGRGVVRNLPRGVVKLSVSHRGASHRETMVIDEKTSAEVEKTIRMSQLKLGEEREADTAKVSAAEIPPPPPLGSVAPPLTVEVWSDGKSRSLDDYRGQVVVLQFWGTWCSACLNAVPAVKQIVTNFADRTDVVFLGVHSAGEDMETIRALLDFKQWPLPTGLDRGREIGEGETVRAYGARGWPTTVIIDRMGKISHSSNLENWDVLTAMMEQARLAKAANLPPVRSGMTEEEKQARGYAMHVQYETELIERALSATSAGP